MINGVKWNDLSEDVKGDIYEGLLEKIAQDTKSGARQYFTPRALINVIVKCVNPQPGKKITDPCCGSGGFLLSAKRFLSAKISTAEGETADTLKNDTFFGNEIVPNTYRLCLMNLLLHGIGEMGGRSPIQCKDSLASTPSADELSDYVLTNPPFGKKYNHTTGKALKKSNSKGTLKKKNITTSNLYWNSFDFSEVRSMYFTDYELDKCTATKGELLVCNGGDVGRAAIWNYDYDICIQNHISKLRPKTSEIDNNFYLYVLWIKKIKGELNGKGVGITSLSAKDLLSILISLPPLSEQKLIVSEIEKWFGVLDSISEAAE